MTSAQLHTMRSVYNLSMRGATEGERSAAAGRLNALLNKHGMTMDQFHQQAGITRPRPQAQPREEARSFDLRYRGKEEKQIMKQAIFRVLRTDRFIREKTRKTVFRVMVTRSQYNAIMSEFEKYKRSYQIRKAQALHDIIVEMRTY